MTPHKIPLGDLLSAAERYRYRHGLPALRALLLREVGVESAALVPEERRAAVLAKLEEG